MDTNAIKNKAKPTDFVVLIPNYAGWDDMLDIRDALRDDGFSVFLIDRFFSDVVIVPKSKMNELGWYKNG
jgi:hypothetical protein